MNCGEIRARERGRVELTARQLLKFTPNREARKKSRRRMATCVCVCVVWHVEYSMISLEASFSLLNYCVNLILKIFPDDIPVNSQTVFLTLGFIFVVLSGWGMAACL